METLKHVVKALQTGQRLEEPFPLIYATGIFPPKLYNQMLRELDKKDDFAQKAFANRTFAEESILPGVEFLQSKEFLTEMLALFPAQRDEMLAGSNKMLAREIRLIRDHQHYKIGPHTDGPWKVLSLLFYLPKTDEFAQYGTSIYVPKDPEFRCVGGPHYKFEDFTEVARAPYLPNSCVAFWKTDHSFHGVAPIPVPIRRDVLLFNVYRKPDGENENVDQ